MTVCAKYQVVHDDQNCELELHKCDRKYSDSRLCLQLIHSMRSIQGFRLLLKPCYAMNKEAISNPNANCFCFLFFFFCIHKHKYKFTQDLWNTYNDVNIPVTQQQNY